MIVFSRITFDDRKKLNNTLKKAKQLLLGKKAHFFVTMSAHHLWSSSTYNSVQRWQKQRARSAAPLGVCTSCNEAKSVMRQILNARHAAVYFTESCVLLHHSTGGPKAF